ncbi:VOC family protein [Halomonas sabkhae]|uniref:VOC family protein n=1 Tax=Halomonas sabkhae TaxID=626223 RepID=UPI0025B37B4A|nr:VOC family protein [Halomonas sabkhae]MDN3525602.1 VOC family protein [Halomonas sabkhae]
MIETSPERDRPALQLNLLVLRCQALEVSRRFYERLGFRFVKEQHGDGPIHYASQEAGMVFELYPLLEGDVADHTRLGFSVPNLEEIVPHIETMTRHSILGEVVHIARDPDGRKVELIERTT